ncbi:MAG: hypothetical protein JNK73_09655 [Bacteroidia bacterium]|nr:hypothetical protein [Bacteroidia bacterium]
MKNSILLLLLCSVLFLPFSCKKKSNTNTATCSDGVQNQNETAIDCGGPCSKCVSCSDGIQNQGETAVDCGGPCAKCPILYPDTGIYGINILRYASDTITLKGNKMYSALAIMAPQTSLRVRITNPQGAGINWSFILGIGKWVLDNVNSNSQELRTTNNASYVDAEFGFGLSAIGTAVVEIFENGANSPTRKVVLYWFP